MKHIAAAIYISFGFLFYILGGFNDLHAPDNMNLVISLFMLAGVAYLIRALGESFGKFLRK